MDWFEIVWGIFSGVGLVVVLLALCTLFGG